MVQWYVYRHSSVGSRIGFIQKRHEKLEKIRKREKSYRPSDIQRELIIDSILSNVILQLSLIVMFILRSLVRVMRPFSTIRKYLLILGWILFVWVMYVALQVPRKIDCRVKCYDDVCHTLAHIGCPQKGITTIKPPEETPAPSASPAQRDPTPRNFIEDLPLSDEEQQSELVESHPLFQEGLPMRYSPPSSRHRPSRKRVGDILQHGSKIHARTNHSEKPYLSSKNILGVDTDDIDNAAGTMRLDDNSDNAWMNNGAGSEQVNGVTIIKEAHSLSEDHGSPPNTVTASAPTNIADESASHSPNYGAQASQEKQASPKDPALECNEPQISPSSAGNCSKISADKTLEMYYGDEKRKCAAQDLEAAVNISESNDGNDPYCPCIPPNLVGRLKLNLSTEFDLEDLWDSDHLDVELGGEWQPPNCQSRTRLAIIVPYRDRRDHLKIFLRHMLPILKRQLTHFRIFVVEQSEPAVFNKAAMMNIGFVEAVKQFQFDCVVFHDVDIVMEDDRSLLNCGDTPHHYAISLDRWNYSLRYETVFGAVISLRPEMFKKSNGFSNSFFGWGGEDDDMSRRVRRYWTFYRPPMEVGRYTTLKHTRDSANAVNEDRTRILKRQKTRMKTDGLNSIRYNLEKIDKLPLFTWILASVDVSNLPYPDHVSQTYNESTDVCTDDQAMSSRREQALVTCQYDCDNEGHSCIGVNHRIDGFNRECWLINGNCSSYETVRLEPSAVRTYLKTSRRRLRLRLHYFGKTKQVKNFSF